MAIEENIEQTGNLFEETFDMTGDFANAVRASKLLYKFRDGLVTLNKNEVLTSNGVRIKFQGDFVQFLCWSDGSCWFQTSKYFVDVVHSGIALLSASIRGPWCVVLKNIIHGAKLFVSEDDFTGFQIVECSITKALLMNSAGQKIDLEI